MCSKMCVYVVFIKILMIHNVGHVTGTDLILSKLVFCVGIIVVCVPST